MMPSSRVSLGRAAALAVEHGHLAFVIAVTGHRPGRGRALDRGEIVLAQLQPQRVDGLGEPVTSGRADHRDDVGAAGEHPGDRQLGDGHAQLFLCPQDPCHCGARVQ